MRKPLPDALSYKETSEPPVRSTFNSHTKRYFAIG